MQKDPFHHRKLRSFVRREGRLTQAQRLALIESGNIILPASEQALDWETCFGGPADRRVVELGFGDGASLLRMAEQAPSSQFIGLEVYRTGAGNLLNKMEQVGVTNLRIAIVDAQMVFPWFFADESLDTIQIFFPDPWPKKRHHKRRLVQTEFLSILHRKLKSGGILHVATDWADYAEHVLLVLGQAEGWENVAGAGNAVARPESRPLTKYEKRGLGLGHTIVDLQFLKR